MKILLHFLKFRKFLMKMIFQCFLLHFNSYIKMNKHKINCPNNTLHKQNIKFTHIIHLISIHN